MSITKRFIPIQASLERILDTTSENKISIQDGKVLYTIDGGFSFFDLSGIRYLKTSVAAVENPKVAEDNLGITRLRSAKGKVSVVNSLSDGYKIYYTDSSGEVFHVAGGVSPDTKNTAGAMNSDDKLFLVGSPIQDFSPRTYTNVNVFVENGELTANKLIAKEKMELGVETGPEDEPVTSWWEFDPLNSNALNFRNKTNTGRAILQITNSNKIIAYTDNITSAINTLNTTIQTQLEGKQDTLISGTNIKTLGGQNLLGSGDLSMAAIGAAAANHTHTISQISDATTLGQNLVKLANGSAVTFPRFNENNTVDKLNAADFRAAIGAGTSSTTGTVTSIVTNNGITGGPISTTGTIGLIGRALALHNLDATSGVIEASTGTSLTIRVIDTTTGGTLGSANLITSGAVFAGLALKENISNKKTTLTNNTTDYPSTGAVKTYVDTQITTIDNSKVDNAPTDGKVYGQQYGDWTSLEDTAELRDALCFEGS